MDYYEFDAPAVAVPLAAAAEFARSGIWDQYMVYEKAGVYTVAAGVAGELIADRHSVRLLWPDRETVQPWGDAGLRRVADVLRSAPVSGWNAYGWASFELSYLLAGLADDAVGGEPLIHLVIPRVEVRFGPGFVSGRALSGAERDLVLNAVGALENLSTGDLIDSPGPGTPRPGHRAIEVSGPDAGTFQAAVAAAVEDIKQRRLQKVILSRILPVGFDVDLIGTYVAGRLKNNPARSFLFDFGAFRSAGFSPEIVVEVGAHGLVTTQPLAGTRAAVGGADAIRRLRTELQTDAKEVFEHAVSVKASYEEVRRVCAPDSVLVHDFMSVKQRGSVQHLGSRVTGMLLDGRTAWDALATIFPAVTASGIPKRAAFEVIRRYEPGPRGLYAGAVLKVGADDTLDAALVLRSIYQRDGRTWLRAGAGIVEQSRPAREYEETCEKLRSVATHLVPAPVPARAVDGGMR